MKNRKYIRIGFLEILAILSFFLIFTTNDQMQELKLIIAGWSLLIIARLDRIREKQNV